MAATERELHEQHQTMIKTLAERHARITRLDSADAVFDTQYTDLVACAEQLLEFEKALPAQLAEPQRRRTAQIVRWSWRSQSAVAAALVVAVFALGHTAWWLLLLIPHLLATLVGWPMEVTTKRHKQQRVTAISLHALCLLVILIVLGVLSAWWIVAVIVGWVAVGVASQDSAEQGAKK